MGCSYTVLALLYSVAKVASTIHADVRHSDDS